MKAISKAIPLVLALLLIATQVTVAQTTQPLYGGTIRVAYRRDPISLNGILNYWSTTAYISTHVLNKLLTYDKDYNIVGDLAKSWENTPDGKTWTFKLKDNVYWSDGTKFTSADVKFHYQKLLEYESTVKPHLLSLKTIETPDDYTVVFKFDKPSRPTPFGLSSVGSDQMILPKHVFEKGDFKTNPANWQMIGTGPFIVSEYVKDSHIIMVPNPKWSGGRPYLDKLIFRFIPQPASALLALEGGEIDHVHENPGIPLQEIGRLRKSEKIAVDTWSYTTTWRITLNFREEAVAKNPWLKDVRVRQALSHAIDRKTIIEKVLYGSVTEIYGPISDLVKPYYNPNIAKYAYDPVKAEQLLDAAGFKRGPDGVRFKAKFPVYATASDIAEVIKDMLKKVGIDVEVILVENTTFYEKYEHGEKGLEDFPMALNTMGGGPDPGDIRSWIDGVRKTGGMNFGFYNNTRVNELLEIGATAIDYAKRKAAYDEVQELVCKDLPFIFLFHNWKVQAYNKEFNGLQQFRPVGWYASYAKVWWSKGQPPTTTVATTKPTTTTPKTEPSFDNMTLAAVAVAIIVIAGVALYFAKRKK